MHTGCHLVEYIAHVCTAILRSHCDHLAKDRQPLWPFQVSRFARDCFRSSMCFLTFVLAEAIPQLGLFISLVGAVSSTALALVFPPIIEMVVCWQNASLGLFTISKDILIVLIGLLGFVTGTYESITSIIKAFST